MASNLSQSSNARNLLLAWRSQVADKRNENFNPILPKNTSIEGIAHLEEVDIEEDGDDVHLIIDLLRRQHGHQTGEGLKRKQKVAQYLEYQLSYLRDIYEVSDLSKKPKPITYTEKTLEKSRKP